MVRSFLIIAALVLTGVSPASAKSIVAKVDLSQQRLHLYVGGKKRATWRVSTARRGYRTPIGRFRPTRLHRHYYSRKYNNSPMPHSVFFVGGYAIHGTTYIKQLGRPASHGCVRLHPRNAAKLFGLIRKHGSKNTRIVVTR